jgi:hypothetical protein
MTSEEIQEQVMDLIHKEGHELPNNEYFDMLHEIISLIRDEINAAEEENNH